MDTLNVIRQDRNGMYSWAGTVDVGYEQKTFRIAFGVVGGISFMLIVMSLSMGGDVLGITLLSCLGALAVTGGVCWLFNRNAGKRRQRYRMTEDCVIFVAGRATNPFYFKSIRRAVVYPERYMIELYPPVGSGPVFAPPEDWEFVRDFILQRISQADVTTECG